MKIDLQKLMRASVPEIPFAGTADLHGESFFGEYPFQHPVQYRGVVQNRLGVLRLTGTVETIYVTVCARCAKPLEVPLQAAADMLLVPAGEGRSEEEHVFLLEGDWVDPEAVLVPALLLEINMAYLCKPDCRGLCPRCGADLNAGPCGCGKPEIDERFAVLQQLLERRRRQDENQMESDIE